MSSPVKAAYKSPGKVIFILTFLHCIQKTKLRFFRSPLFETCVLAAGDFPQAGTLGSNETICCGIFWLGGKLSRYCRCWMYLMANLFWGRKTYTTSKLTKICQRNKLWKSHLRDSIFDNLFPGGLHHGSLALKSSNDLFMSFMRARSRSQAERLYCSGRNTQNYLDYSRSLF